MPISCYNTLAHMKSVCFTHHIRPTTVRTGIIGPRARTLELPLLVRSGSFFFLFCLRLGLRGSVFAVRSPPYPREGISDFKVSGPIIPVLTVPSPVVLLLGRHNSVSPCGARGPCSNPAVLKCARTERSKNCRPVRSSLLGSFPVGPPGAPDRCEHC